MNNIICFSRTSRPRPELYSLAPTQCAVVWATPQMNRHMYFPAFIKKLDVETFFRPESVPSLPKEACVRALDYLSYLKEETDLWEAL